MTTFALVRILGNDLPPLYTAPQMMKNLAFILMNERPHNGCKMIFILNRIINPALRAVFKSMISQFEANIVEIKFEVDEYRNCITAKDRAAYITNNNPARNLAIRIGSEIADIVMPFDGQLHLSQDSWDGIEYGIHLSKAPIYIVAMHRVLHNDETLTSDGHVLPAEPQLMFRNDCEDRFDESIAYGDGPKIEMLLRLGIPGPWDHWSHPYWIQLRKNLRYSKNVYLPRWAGICYRLATGNRLATLDIEARGIARREAIAHLVGRADETLL